MDCTDAYRYGYDIGKTGNFHHETRGPDGVTYGCYGHIDPNKILRATHYVADTRGYRTVEPQKPVVTYPEADDPIKGPSSGILLQWDELYFPIGCGKFEGGVRPDIPLVFIDDVRVNKPLYIDLFIIESLYSRAQTTMYSIFPNLRI